MNQKTAWTMLAVGFAITGYMVKEIVGDHQSWHELTTPQAVGHAGLVVSGLGVMLAGALGVDLSKLLNR